GLAQRGAIRSPVRRARPAPRPATLYNRGLNTAGVPVLWVKTLHIVFIASWFAGLFYLPRIFVNLTQHPDPAVQSCLLGMARRLFRFTTLLAVAAVAFGLWLYVGYGIGMGPGNGWMHAKLALVLAIIGYHHGCGVLLRKF